MSKETSGLFRMNPVTKEVTRIPPFAPEGQPGQGLNHPATPGASGQGHLYHKKSIPISGNEPSKSKATHVLKDPAGRETPLSGLNDPAAKGVETKKGFTVTSLRDYDVKDANTGKMKQIKAGQVLKKEYENTAKAVAKELSEAWWCGTPEVMEKERKKAPPATTRQPDRAGNWSVNAVDKPVTEGLFGDRVLPKLGREADYNQEYGHYTHSDPEDRTVSPSDARRDDRRNVAGLIKKARDRGVTVYSDGTKIKHPATGSETLAKLGWQTKDKQGQLGREVKDKLYGAASKTASELTPLTQAKEIVKKTTGLYKMKRHESLEAFVTEAEKVRKAPKTKKDKPNRVPDAKNEDPAMAHAKKIMKMANCVAGSVHASPLGILAAEYAKHTFHPDNIGEGLEETSKNHSLQDQPTRDKTAKEIRTVRRQTRNIPLKRFINHDSPNSERNALLAKKLDNRADKAADRADSLETKWGNSYTDSKDLKTQSYNQYDKSTVLANAAQRMKKLAGHQKETGYVGEATEIVNKFIEDTMTGDVASMAIGFAPTGEMDPHEGRPGKKKKKKGQFQELSKEVSGGSYGKLARKVAGNMSGV